MPALIIILSIIALLLILSWIALELTFKGYFTRDEKYMKNEQKTFERLRKEGNGWIADLIIEGQKEIYSHEYEDHYIDSFDSLRLHGRFYKNPSGKKCTVLCVHGYHSKWDLDFSCGFKPFFYLCYNIMIIDQRSHTGSEGKYVTFGNSERFDIKDWCRHIVDFRGEDEKIVIYGISMGCTTSVNAAALEDMPKNLCAVVADCGFTSAAQEISHVMIDDLHLPRFPIYAIIKAMAKRRANFDFDEVSTVESVKNIDVPIIFVHGDADTFVLPECSKKNYEACTSPEKQLYIVSGAAHAQSFLVGGDEAKAKITEFVSSCLGS